MAPLPTAQTPGSFVAAAVISGRAGAGARQCDLGRLERDAGVVVDGPYSSSEGELAPATTARAPAGTHSAAEPTRPEPARNGRPSQVDRVATPKTAIPEEKSLPEASTGNGAEELSLAQRYLNGTSGQRRDSAEAAKWLWKSIAKHNAEASLLLSDLYLRGDGVSKNCDQARVLLDAAAIRGVKDAGPRLRHLQAFGCQ